MCVRVRACMSAPVCVIELVAILVNGTCEVFSLLLPSRCAPPSVAPHFSFRCSLFCFHPLFTIDARCVYSIHIYIKQ